MTASIPNKPDSNQIAVAPKKRRSPKGSPRPYKDGKRWKVKGHYIDADGIKRTAYGTGSTGNAAKARLELNLNKKKISLRESKIPDGASTVGPYCTYWLEKVKMPQDHLAYKTYTGYESVIRNWIIPHLGKVKLIDLKRQHLINLFEAIRTSGRSRSLQNQVRAVMLQALDHAVGEDHLTISPYRSIKLMKQSIGIPDYFEFEEAGKLLRAARTLNQELNLDIQLNYGMRQSERLGLIWGDIELDGDAPCIRLTQQIQRQTGKGLVRVGLKTNSCQVFYPTEYTVGLLRQQKAAFDLGRAVHGQNWNREGYVFWNSRGNPVDSTADRDTWVRILGEAGVTFRVGHTTRKTTGTLIEDPEAAFGILGHKQQTTMYKHYRAMRDEKKKLNIEKLQKQILES